MTAQRRLPVALLGLCLLAYGLVLLLTSWFDSDTARIAAAVLVAVLGFWSGISLARWPTVRPPMAEQATQILRRPGTSRTDDGPGRDG